MILAPYLKITKNNNFFIFERITTMRMAVKRSYKPKNDNEFLEDLAMIIFVSGFRYSLVEERWPLIKKAFYNFNTRK